MVNITLIIALIVVCLMAAIMKGMALKIQDLRSSELYWMNRTQEEGSKAQSLRVEIARTKMEQGGPVIP